MIVKSYAKINLALNVYPRREDGLHELDSVFLPLELHDSLQISKIRNSPDSFVTFANVAITKGKSNLATRALHAIEKEKGIKEKFQILINKNIPVSAGLGGGSSNAAATLVGIAKLTKTEVTVEELMKIGFTLGSDVPYFVLNTPARVQGAGEKVTPITVKNQYYALIIKPDEGLSTAEMYKKCDEMELPVFNIDKVVEALALGDDDMLSKYIGNALETPAIATLPLIEDIKNDLKNMGFKLVLMSGSGSSVFAISQDKKMIKNAFKKYVNSAFDGRVEITKVLR